MRRRDDANNDDVESNYPVSDRIKICEPFFFKMKVLKINTFNYQGLCELVVDWNENFM